MDAVVHRVLHTRTQQWLFQSISCLMVASFWFEVADTPSGVSRRVGWGCSGFWIATYFHLQPASAHTHTRTHAHTHTCFQSLSAWRQIPTETDSNTMREIAHHVFSYWQYTNFEHKINFNSVFCLTANDRYHPASPDGIFGWRSASAGNSCAQESSLRVPGKSGNPWHPGWWRWWRWWQRLDTMVTSVALVAIMRWTVRRIWLWMSDW